MSVLLAEIRHNPLLWLLAFVPVVLVGHRLVPDAHSSLFALSILAIVPLAALLSHATESVAVKTGDTVGGLLNATLGNLTELVIGLTALRLGQYTLVKASIAGARQSRAACLESASPHHTCIACRCGGSGRPAQPASAAARSTAAAKRCGEFQRPSQPSPRRPARLIARRPKSLLFHPWDVRRGGRYIRRRSLPFLRDCKLLGLEVLLGGV